MGGMFVKRALLSAAMACAFAGACAQEIEEEGVFYHPFEDDYREIPVDTTLFYMPLGEEVSIFSSLTRYGLSAVSYRPRGLDERLSRASVAGIEVSSGIGRYPDYSLYTALSALSPQSSRAYRDMPSGFYSPLASDMYEVSASSASQRWTAIYTYSDRRYRTGVRIRGAGEVGRGWHYALSLRGRWGRDAYIKGVFTDALMGSLAVEKSFRSGRSVSLFMVGYTQQRGMKGWTEAEAYRLRGDNLYNPYWGYDGGRVRNSRVRREWTPLAVVAFDSPVWDGAALHAAIGVRMGSRSRSGIQWTDASNPAPDYYMNLPGHRAEPHVIEALEEAWRSGNPLLTQINWNGMYEVNFFAPDGRSAYISGSQVERIGNVQAVCSVSGGNEYGFGYECGLKFRYDRTRFFRVASDLLGGRYVPNRDPFTGADCNVRKPHAVVGCGDEYGYNYDIRLRSAALHGVGHYREGRWGITFGAEIVTHSVERVGRYEKEGLPGNLSYGSSGAFHFIPYTLYIDGRYNFNAAHRIFVQVYMGEYAPDYADILVSPEYCNSPAGKSHTRRIAGVQADYRLPVSNFARLQAAAYFQRTASEVGITRYYDDLYGRYCALVMSGIAKSDWGVEIGLEIDITERLNVAAAVALGSYTYAEDPSVTVMDEATREILLENDTAHLKGFVHSGSPQTIVAAAINYSPRGQWNFSAQWSYADRRYVTPNPLRRTERIASLASSGEERAACLRQERLPGASVVSISVSKGMTLFGIRLFASFTVNNLLGRKDIVYGGYEQMRLDKFSSAGGTQYRPFPSRYSFSYPRTFLASLTITF